jgi:hypothetical protein
MFVLYTSENIDPWIRDITICIVFLSQLMSKQPIKHRKKGAGALEVKERKKIRNFNGKR